MEKEIWKDIPGYIGLYQVSNWGQVKSLKYGKERILKPSNGKNKYLLVNLCKDKKIKAFTIHKLMAITFLGHTPDGNVTVVNHIDNNPLNNNLDNLELVTHRYNSSCHKVNLGIYWNKPINKWVTHIKIDKIIHLGVFIDKQDALDMYQKALNNQHLYNGDNKAFRLALATVTL